MVILTDYILLYHTKTQQYYLDMFDVNKGKKYANVFYTRYGKIWFRPGHRVGFI